MNEKKPVEVLICGAGASGLTLAIELARRSVSFRLIDKLSVPFPGSRGKAIQPRTQEVFEDLGIIDRIAAVGGYYPPQRTHRADGGFDEQQSFAVEPPNPGEPYRTTLLVPQFQTEAVMRRRLSELGHAPEYGHELAAFESNAEEVTARVAGPSGIEAIRCRYLVAGDGGHSFVRQALQLDFPGKTLGVRAIVADILIDGLPRDAWHKFNADDPVRQLHLCPLPHTNLFQLQAPIPSESDVDLSIQGLQALIDARVPNCCVKVQTVAWASAYSMNARLAERYRVGRVFLMGDAAHIHPPTGGQGLNTSVQDAYNLGWKLCAALAGAPETLLDSYEEERRPIAVTMLGQTTDLLGKIQHGHMRRGRDVRQLDLGYRTSSLSMQLVSAEPCLTAGDRAPDMPLRGAAGQPRRMFDLLRGPHWTLISYGGNTANLPQGNRWLHVYGIGADSEFQDTGKYLDRLYGMSDGDLVLVRPDGYIGAAVNVENRGRITDYLARVAGA